MTSREREEAKAVIKLGLLITMTDPIMFACAEARNKGLSWQEIDDMIQDNLDDLYDAMQEAEAELEEE